MTAGSPKSIKYDFRAFSEQEMTSRAQEFCAHMVKRRTLRDFDRREVPAEVVEAALRTAASAPSGANQQPWRFVVVRDAETKARIRRAAEAEERAFYGHRASREWLRALEPFGTDEHKPFLEEAPVLIAIFLERYGVDAEGKRVKHYYVTESVGISTGFLIAALHHAGLATLTHTPIPMKFLNEILGRPENERPFLLLVVGYPKEDAEVPDIERLPFKVVVSEGVAS